MPKKRRSEGQRNHLTKIRNNRLNSIQAVQGDHCNEKPPKQEKTRKERVLATNHPKSAIFQVSNILRELRNARKRIKYFQNRYCKVADENQQLLGLLSESKAKLTELENQFTECSKRLAHANQCLVVLGVDVMGLKKQVRRLEVEKIDEKGTFEQQLSNFQQDIDLFRHKFHTASSQLARAQQQVKQLQLFKKEAREVIQLTQEGYYKPEIRSLVRRLASYGIPLTKCGTVLGMFVQVFGVALKVDVSKVQIPSVRTVGRFIAEGNVASKLQTAVELKESGSFTSGGDGTTNKSQNFDSLHYNVQLWEMDPDTNTKKLVWHVRFGNVRLSENHQAMTQVRGEMEYMEEIVDLFNQSPLAAKDSEPPLSTAFLAMKYYGTHGDHAEDQKAKHRLLAA